ncbi:MAG: hydrogenase expression/formation protein HypE [Bryobacterales bacterium]
MITCPAPLTTSDRVLLGHGGGGRLSGELIQKVFLKRLQDPLLQRLDDQAIFDSPGARLAFTTDSFVVKPLFFPGGDIGSLAVYGTVNDLAMGGAIPRYMSLAMILEEGLPLETLETVTESIARAAERCGVAIVTGDTKVVEHGSGDGLFINTTGIGVVPGTIDLSAANVRPGDVILLSGSLGDHGITIMAKREGIDLECDLESDSAPLDQMVRGMIEAHSGIRCMRDPTRGGLASALNEIAAVAGVSMRLDEARIPIKAPVRGACELLGLDPLYVANEGKLVAIVAPEAADAVLVAMRATELGHDAARIGVVREGRSGLVTISTSLGAERVVDMLSGDQLPRIC